MAPIRGIWLAFACTAIACDVDDLYVDDATGDVVVARSMVGNNIALNSAVLNGVAFNGVRLNGSALNGWSLNGWSLNGWSLNGISLDGSLFSGTQYVDGQPVQVSGEALIGTRMMLEHDGVNYTLRFDDVRRNPADPNSDVWFYAISILNNDTNTWSSFCRDHNNQPTDAIPIHDFWDLETGDRYDDASAITLACRDGALAKCIEWGYRPWASATHCDGGTCESVSLEDYHQACTRMVRADYCGDGNAHTLTGTPIDVFDPLSPAIQSPATLDRPNWGIEAEWGPDGALCVGAQRRLSMYDELQIPYTMPPCLEALEDVAGCGDMAAARGAKVANRYCDQWMSDPAACNEVE